MDYFCKPFIFNAKHYEVWKDQQCIDSADVNVRIVATISGDLIYFRLIGDFNISIEHGFMMSMQTAVQLDDRVQYGLLSSTTDRSTTPIVCNLFNDMRVVRFALVNPFRLVEFYGEYEYTQIPQIEMFANKLVNAYIRRRGGLEMVGRILGEIHNNPKELINVQDLQVMTHAMTIVFVSKVVEREDMISVATMTGYWCITKAIEQEPNNYNLYIDRILLMQYGFEGMKLIAKNILGHPTNLYNFFDSNVISEINARDMVYLMIASDIYNNPDCWTISSIEEIKKNLDEKIQNKFFSPIVSKEDIIAAGKSYQESIMKNINDRICERGDFMI